MLNLKGFAEEQTVDLEKEREQIDEYAQKEEHKAVVKLAEKYIELDPVNIGVLAKLAEANLHLGNFALAEDSAKQAIKQEETNSWALKTLSMVYREQARQSKSASDLGYIEELNVVANFLWEICRQD